MAKVEGDICRYRHDEPNSELSRLNHFLNDTFIGEQADFLVPTEQSDESYSTLDWRKMDGQNPAPPLGSGHLRAGANFTRAEAWHERLQEIDGASGLAHAKFDSAHFTLDVRTACVFFGSAPVKLPSPEFAYSLRTVHVTGRGHEAPPKTADWYILSRVLEGPNGNSGRGTVLQGTRSHFVLPKMT